MESRFCRDGNKIKEISQKLLENGSTVFQSFPKWRLKLAKE